MKETFSSLQKKKIRASKVNANHVARAQPPPQALRFSQGRGERLVMSRKGPWEGSFPPSFARARETSGYEAGARMFP